MQTHVVFGAGLIGCFLGGVLSSLQLHTSLVCRPRIKDKLINGLKLTDYQENKTEIKQLNFIDSEDLKKLKTFCDFLWITVKCTSIDQASEDIQSLVGPETIILCTCIEDPKVLCLSKLLL